DDGRGLQVREHRDGAAHRQVVGGQAVDPQAAGWVLAHQARRSVGVLEQSDVTALVSHRRETALVGVWAAGGAAHGDADPAVGVARVVDVQVHDVHAGGGVADDLRAFDDAVGPEVPAVLPGQRHALTGP